LGFISSLPQIKYKDNKRGKRGNYSGISLSPVLVLGEFGRKGGGQKKKDLTDRNLGLKTLLLLFNINDAND
jgi:hypothetical protein